MWYKIGLGISILLNILFLIFRVQVHVTQSQRQTQSVKTDVWSINNNQNVNINTMVASGSGMLVYSNYYYSTPGQALDFAGTLAPYQQMYTYVVGGDRGYVVYPVLVSKVQRLHISTSNFNTNYNSNELNWGLK